MPDETVRVLSWKDHLRVMADVCAPESEVEALNVAAVAVVVTRVVHY